MRTKLAVGGVGIAVCAAVLVFTGYALGAPKAPPKTPPKRPFSADQKTAGATAAQPFANNNGQIPPTSQYSGPLFQLSYNRRHLSLGPVPNPPWVQAIGGGRITPQNAAAYVAALKQYVSANAQTLIWNYPAWNAGNVGWYNQPWLGSIRESIHGMYTGSEFPADTFPGTGLKKTITTYVLTYYDTRASETLYKVWGSEAMNPRVTTTATTQFPEESVIVKAAFVDVTAADWPEMAGTAVWPLYIPINDTNKRPAVVQSSLMQFDIIVKDTRSAPRTGWVFATLVYDKTAPGSGWDKMVPLGAMWGNDPEVNSAANPHPPLQENWINTRAPLYSRQTLGWGGRLSGPNDGAVNAIQVGQQTYNAYPNSSCMSCHSPANWPMKSFLLPATDPQPSFSSNGTYLLSPAPGSPDWMKWFQSRPGNVPQDAGTVALDYDMVFAFKSLPLWSKATGKPVPMLARPGHRTVTPPETNYNGMPIR